MAEDRAKYEPISAEYVRPPGFGPNLTMEHKPRFTLCVPAPTAIEARLAQSKPPLKRWQRDMLMRAAAMARIKATPKKKSKTAALIKKEVKPQ